MKKAITFIVMSALCLCACQKDNTLLYGGSAIGNYADNCLHSDDGQTFRITENICETSPEESMRMLAEFDILSKNGDRDYNIRLKRFSKVLCKEAVHEDSPELGNDPIEIAAGWVTKGYVNILAGVPLTSTTSSTHYINMYIPGNQAQSDTLEVYFRHNGHVGTTPANESESYAIFRDYVSFPMSSIFTTGQERKVLRFHWTWYKNVTGQPSDVLTEFKENMTL